MNLIELKNILEATGFPVAYSHFVETDDQPLPEPPFICFLVAYSSNFMADDVVYRPIQNIQIELYTMKKDLGAESLLESALIAHDIPFQTTEAFIESEQIFQKIYEVRMI